MSDSKKQVFAEKPKEGQPWDVIIIGSGPSAWTAAIYTTRGAASTLVIAGEQWGGQLMLTTEVDNYPGFPQGIMGPELMEKMKDQAERFGCVVVENKASEVDFSNAPFEIKSGDNLYKAHCVIVATGAETKWLGVPGEDKLRGRGVSSCAPCDAPFFKDKDVIVVGGGDSAMTEALVLTKYASSVTVIHRRGKLAASEAMQKNVFEKEDEIKFLWDSEIVEMIGENKLEKVKIKTKKESKITKDIDSEEREDGYIYWDKKIDGVFVAIGHTPATEIFSEEVELDDKGYIKRYEKNGYKTSTSIEGVFVSGDVHDYHYRQAITAAGFGCMAGMEALKYLDKSTPSW